MDTFSAWFWGAGNDISLLSGAVSSELTAQLSAVYDDYADTWVYLPMPLNWNGHYVLPVLNGSPLRIVERDRATGWIVGSKDYDPIPPSAGSFAHRAASGDGNPRACFWTTRVAGWLVPANSALTPYLRFSSRSRRPVTRASTLPAARRTTRGIWNSPGLTVISFGDGTIASGDGFGSLTGRNT